MPVALAERLSDRPAIEKEAKRFQRVADRRIPKIRTTIGTILHDARDAFASDLILRGVRDSDWTLIREGIPHLGQRIALVKDDEGDAEEALDAQLADAFGAGSEYALRLVPSFDLVDQQAVQYARDRAGGLLRDFDEAALTNAREAVAFGIEHGRTVEQTARYLEQTAYLPPRAKNAVENYFLGLIDRVERGESLAEAARFTGKYRALSPKKFLDAQNVDTLVDRYASRWIDFTAEAAARTLTIEASNAGLREGWNQAAQDGLFDAATAVLQWYATDDERTCPQCDDLDGTEVAFDGGSWETDMGDADFPPAHPLCRCTMVLIMGKEADLPAFAQDAEEAA